MSTRCQHAIGSCHFVPLNMLPVSDLFWSYVFVSISVACFWSDMKVMMQIVSVDEEEDEIEALNLGIIAAYYYIQYTTIKLLASSLTAKTKLKGLLEIISSASEFDDLPMRPGELSLALQESGSACAIQCNLHFHQQDLCKAMPKAEQLPILRLSGFGMLAHITVCLRGCPVRRLIRDLASGVILRLRHFGRMPVSFGSEKGIFAVQVRTSRCASCCCMRRWPLMRPSGLTPTPRSTHCCSLTCRVRMCPQETWPLTRGLSSSRPPASYRSALPRKFSSHINAVLSASRGMSSCCACKSHVSLRQRQ